MKLNGVLVYTAPRDGSVYIPLPRGMWDPVDSGCQCFVCNGYEREETGRRRDVKPAWWDTIVIPGPGSIYSTAFTVHMPELHRFPGKIDWLVQGRPKAK